jgi:glucose-6-phosphate 1-dehydrogenase
MISIIIFGGTGDLAKKKLFKSLYHLYSKKLIPDNTKIIGFARRDFNTGSYRQFVSEQIPEELDLKSEFLELFYYFQGDLYQEDSYRDLRKFLMELDQQNGLCSAKLFYLSVRPELYEDVFSFLKKTDILHTCTDELAWSRLLIEKPFGTNFEHAKKLDELLGAITSENNIFRIDHYLAKEALENLLIFRFKNELFKAIWKKDFISKITITLFEKRSVEGRGEFYNEVGALRDVGQNHALQMLTMILMDEPVDLTGEFIRKEREKVLQTLSAYPINSEFFERKQYKDFLKHSQQIQSKTETYFKITLQSDLEQWKGVPCIIQSGKLMHNDQTTIQVDFKDGNSIFFELQPIPRIAVSFHVKDSGYDFKTSIKTFEFTDKTQDIFKLDAYEKILYQAVVGDVTSFISTSEVLEQWRIIDFILKHWGEIPLLEY